MNSLSFIDASKPASSFVFTIMVIIEKEEHNTKTTNVRVS